MMHHFQQWLVECVTLFWMPFLHEDVAIVTAATFIHELGLPITLAFGSLYAGVVVSDLLIFFLGRMARKSQRLLKYLDSMKLQQAQIRLKENRILAIACCRLLPGVLFPTFAACGWFGISFLDFFVPAMITSATYTGVVLLLVLKFGDIIMTTLGQWGRWAWYLLLAIVLIAALSGVFKKLFNALLNFFLPPRHEIPQSEVKVTTHASLAGMPPLSGLKRKVAAAEKVPTVLFYIPLGLRWIWLGLKYRSLTLPALANPHIEAGGLWGESKSKCLGQIAPEEARWVAPFVAIDRAGGEAVDDVLARALNAVAEHGLEFPLVAKPDVGWQGYGVRLVHTPSELQSYISVYPENATLILQQFVPFDGEAGVFYVRMPGETTGRVLSLTFRYFPHVIGDGTLTVRELIARDARTFFKAQCYTGADTMHQGLGIDMELVPPAGEIVRLSFIGSIRVGGLYRDARSYITDELSRRFDAIATSMPEFYFGRFDIRFKSVESLQQGEEFAIIEINGAGAEAIHMWDPEMSLREAYGELLRFQTLVFEVGEKNRARGYTPMSLRDFWAFTAKQNRLISRYPPSL